MCGYSHIIILVRQVMHGGLFFRSCSRQSVASPSTFHQIPRLMFPRRLRIGNPSRDARHRPLSTTEHVPQATDSSTSRAPRTARLGAFCINGI